MEQQSEEDLLRSLEEVLFRKIEEGSSLAHGAEKQPPSEEVEEHDSGPAAPSALAVPDHNTGAVRCVMAQDA